MLIILYILFIAITKEFLIFNQELLIYIVFISITLILIKYLAVLSNQFQTIRTSHIQNLLEIFSIQKKQNIQVLDHLHYIINMPASRFSSRG